MARHPTAGRLHRPPPPDQEDQFIARVLEFSAWARKHARVIIAAGVAVAVLGIGAIYYATHRSATRQQAEFRLAEIRQTAAMGNPALAARDLETFLAQFGGTPAGQEGRVLLGQILLHTGEPARVPAVVEPLARKLDSPLGPQAAFLLAAAHEETGNHQEAEAVYLRIADRARLGVFRREALDDAARLRLERGEAAGAVELYRRLLEIAPADSPDRPFYELRLGEAQARAGGATQPRS
jgi:tetratricopeptide (TPR) repeat protein